MQPAAFTGFPCSSVHHSSPIISILKVHINPTPFLHTSRTRVPYLFRSNSVRLPTSKPYSTSTPTKPTKTDQMATKKVLVVFGATGLQGGSVVKAILGDPKTREAFTVRGVTRDVSKPSAKALESLGAETVAVSSESRICE